MRAGKIVAAALASALVLGACGSSSGALPEPAEAAVGADCLAPQIVQSLGLSLDSTATAMSHPDVPDAGSVPEGFTPSAVLQCLAGETLTDVAGVWDAVTVRRLEGDLGLLVAALTRPSARVDEGGACPSDAGPAWELWLMDAMGKAIRAALPVDVCGAVQGEVAEAIGTLTEVEVTHYPVRLAHARPVAGQLDGVDPALLSGP